MFVNDGWPVGDRVSEKYIDNHSLMTKWLLTTRWPVDKQSALGQLSSDDQSFGRQEIVDGCRLRPVIDWLPMYSLTTAS